MAHVHARITQMHAGTESIHASPNKEHTYKQACMDAQKAYIHARKHGRTESMHTSTKAWTHREYTHKQAYTQQATKRVHLHVHTKPLMSTCTKRARHTHARRQKDRQTDIHTHKHTHNHMLQTRSHTRTHVHTHTRTHTHTYTHANVRAQTYTHNSARTETNRWEQLQPRQWSRANSAPPHLLPPHRLRHCPRRDGMQEREC